MKTMLIYTEGEMIGDGIILLPFLVALKKALPHLRLTWLCERKTVYTGVLSELAAPLIDEFIELAPETLSLSLARSLRKRKFDAIIDTQRRVKKTLVLKTIPHRKFISSSAKYIFSSKRPRQKHERLVDNMFMWGNLSTGLELQPEPVDLPPGDWDIVAGKVLPDGKDYIGFVPGAGQIHKKWKVENFVALARHCEGRGFVPVFFLGPMERELEDVLKVGMPHAIFPNLSSPYLTIALGRRLKAAVANDSGGGHLLAAGGARMVTLFRNDGVRRKFLPTAPRVVALTPEDFNVPHMEDIPLEAVRGALEEVL
ncbi:MAG TPA: ADP-heptose--LPS heptosyltransferase [Rhodospirillaceae bacterium]|nr:ADP-heptose--LPS heptosyltransferase [Rhodospirillaceae bacterium]